MYTLNTIQHRGSPDTHPIARLCRGHPIVLEVTDDKMRKKKRLPKPRLFITPMSIYGGETDELLVSLEGGGAEVMKSNDLKVTRFFMMGITVTSARVLIAEIKLRSK